MTWRDGFLLALRSSLRRPARTSLTVLAVALGSGLLVALAAISQIADTRIIGELGKGGPTTAIKVVAAQPNPAALDSDNPKPGAAKNIDSQVLESIRKAPGVSSVTPVLAAQVMVIPPPKGGQIPTLRGQDPDRGLPQPFGDSTIGVDLGAVNTLPVTLLAGRLPAAGSMNEVAVTAGYLDHLHLDVQKPRAVVGTELEIGAPQAVPGGAGGIQVRGRWSRALITGVVAQQVGDGGLLTSLQFSQAERRWAVAGADGRSIGLTFPTSEYSALVVVADSLDNIHTVRAEITTLGYSTSAPEHLVATVQKYLHVVDIVLGSIGVIALIIAALGIANAMLAAVRERRREIGVLKAIGARDADVLRWFLVEALLAGVAGGLLGAIWGLVAVAVTAAAVNGYLIAQGLVPVDMGGIPWQITLAGILGAALLALVAAAWPALRAARLPAREAVGGA